MVAISRAEPQSSVEVFRRALATISKEHKSVLGAIGGNFLIAIPGVATWTVVTRGARYGVYDEATEDPIQFLLVCPEELFASVFADETDVDLTPHVASGALVMEGDFKVFERFMNLAAGGDSMLAIRAGGDGKRAPTPLPQRRPSSVRGTASK